MSLVKSGLDKIVSVIAASSSPLLILGWCSKKQTVANRSSLVSLMKYFSAKYLTIFWNLLLKPDGRTFYIKKNLEKIFLDHCCSRISSFSLAKSHNHNFIIGFSLPYSTFLLPKILGISKRKLSFLYIDTFSALHV